MSAKQRRGTAATPAGDDVEPALERAAALLPAWFVARMMDTPGHYGLMLDNGFILVIERIVTAQRAPDGTVWLDVPLVPTGEQVKGSLNRNVFTAPAAEVEASVRADAVSAAFVLSDRSAGEN